MKKIILLLSLIPTISYAHIDAEHGVFASILHSMTSTHHSLIALLLIVACVGLMKLFFENK